MSDEHALLEVSDLKTHFSLRGSFLDRLSGREAGSVKAVDGVSFALRRGEVLGVVGESGSGKTTLGRTLLGLIGPSDGSIRFEGEEIAGLDDRRLRPLRRRMQIVFQDPHASLNPALTIGASVGDPLRFHGLGDGDAEIPRRVAEALERVGLQPAAQFMGKYPGDLSGGQKQRAVLARAVILDPDLLIADEPVSMLDMSVRAKILELMLDLKDQLDLTYVYITHDLATAKFFCDRIAIMYLGKIVELGPAAEIYENPKHPYTVSLLKAIPEPDPARAVPRDLPRGEVPDAVTPPLGCSFHPRCPRAFEVCGWESRDLRTLLENRWTRLPEEEYEAERALIGDLDVLDQPALAARLQAAPGHRGEQVSEVLDRLRADAPDDPFWRGVARIEVEPGHVVVRFHEGLDPRDVEVGETRLQCHLYDQEALERARAAAGQRGGPGGRLAASRLVF
jgi:oligopeptide/dipeptide ABC transporter ATP-binding protein